MNYSKPKNILSVLLLIIFISSGVSPFYSPIICDSESCFQSECCEIECALSYGEICINAESKCCDFNLEFHKDVENSKIYIPHSSKINTMTMLFTKADNIVIGFSTNIQPLNYFTKPPLISNPVSILRI